VAAEVFEPCERSCRLPDLLRERFDFDPRDAPSTEPGDTFLSPALGLLSAFGEFLGPVLAMEKIPNGADFG